MQKILIVAAHPDDEVLGCGGTIARHIDEGSTVAVIFMSKGVSSRPVANVHDESKRRHSAMNAAMKSLGVEHITCCDFPDNQMDSVPLLEVTKAIENIINSFKPNTVYTHFSQDLNIDHRITHQAVMTACRPQKKSTVSKIFSFEILSSTEWNSPTLQAFTPQYIVDISKYWHKKLQALNCYQEELRVFPHSRSIECIEALATLRGCTHGIKMAEAFYIERIINKEL
jgi:N-acetylglucosamine malate deacetylase 1